VLLAVGSALVVSAAWVWVKSHARPGNLPPIRVVVHPDRIRADGYDTAVVSIESDAAPPPKISLLEGTRGAVIEEIARSAGKWQARIRSGILPGRIGLRIELPNHPAATAEIASILDDQDRDGDGTPDFLRLDDSGDRQAFRRWFTFLAEAQYFQDPASRPSEIIDCAALIRYAYREALRAHDRAWAGAAKLPLVPAFESVGKYEYPYTPLGAALFRVRPGPFRSEDLSDGAFLQFADVKTLRRFNTHFVSRDVSRAMPGDLLFFRPEPQQASFHSMIYLGESQVRGDGKRYVLYHTGPTGSDPGEIRRMTLEELLQFPEAGWRPVAPNESFLGVARWNILRRTSNEPEP
jgi:hypothetical protein